MVKCIFTNRIEFPSFFCLYCTDTIPVCLLCSLLCLHFDPKSKNTYFNCMRNSYKHQFLSIRSVVNFKCLPFDLHSFCKMKSWTSNDVDTSCHETEHSEIASLFGITNLCLFLTTLIGVFLSWFKIYITFNVNCFVSYSLFFSLLNQQEHVKCCGIKSRYYFTMSNFSRANSANFFLFVQYILILCVSEVKTEHDFCSTWSVLN